MCTDSQSCVLCKGLFCPFWQWAGTSKYVHFKVLEIIFIIPKGTSKQMRNTQWIFKHSSLLKNLIRYRVILTCHLFGVENLFQLEWQLLTPKMFHNCQWKMQNQQKNLFHELLLSINHSENTTLLPAWALIQAVFQLRFIFYYLILIECAATDTVHKYQAW